jgi:NAD(P)H-flavin reductase
MNTVKRTFFCECISSVFIAGETVSLEFIWPGPAPRGGQFFLIKPVRTGVFLGRPISVAGWAVKEEANILRFLVARRGQGSRDLTELRPGEEAELTGPLGNYWAQPEILECINEGPVAIVAGGIGIAPLLALARELEEKKKVFDFYAGFRSGSFGLESIKPRTLIVASEDGSESLKGRIPDFFDPSGYGGVFTCGPEPMLRQVGGACTANGVPCFISVEKHMACGVGACLGCTVKTTGGNRRCCTDGPIFNAGELCFEG